MHLKTMLNWVTDYKSFVFGEIAWREDSEAATIEIDVRSSNRRRNLDFPPCADHHA